MDNEVTPTVETPSGPRKTALVIAMAILAAVVAGGGVYAYQKSQQDKSTKDLQAQVDTLKSQLAVQSTPTPTSSASPTTTPSVTATPSTESTYTNTAYGYSFTYPSELVLYAGAGNADNLPITPTAAAVNVVPKDGNIGNDGLFYVTSPGMTDLTEAAIRQEWAGSPSTQTITVATVGGLSGYKLVGGDSTFVSTFYYVKNSAGKILQFTVPNNKAKSAAIFSSLSFTR